MITAGGRELLPAEFPIIEYVLSTDAVAERKKNCSRMI